MSKIPVHQKEAAALATIQKAFEKYALEKGTTYEEALAEFSCSNTCKELFDFDSLLWTQGPDYLLAVYEAEQKR